ncbi:MAG TPA: T9SS type A sorting domain-containing protein, partial [Bacteroidia bacterium]|nr:T9SS type A sorting domain-containing protein [Bacteroidia bacterium]
MVTVDSLSKNNVLYWNKTINPDAKSFIIYREVTTGVYNQIGSVSKDSLSMFTDTTRSVGPANGNPNITTYRYKISVKDTCGNEGTKSPYHTSIYFNDQHTGAFTWNTYTIESMSVTPVTTFQLQRDSNNTGYWKTIGTAAGTANILNDPQYSTFQFVANWRVQANGFNCTPTARYGNNSSQTSIVKSKSNITNNRTTGITTKLNNNSVAAYPNPAQNILTVVFPQANKTTIKLRNLLGEEIIITDILNESTTQLDISKLAGGVYLLEVSNNTGKFIQRIIKE